MTRSRTSTAGLLRRARRHVRGISLGLSVLVAVLCAVVLAAPTAVTATASQEAREALGDGPPSGRYLIARTGTAPETGPASGAGPTSYDAADARLYGGYAERLADVRAHLPGTLRASTGPARWSLTTGALLLSSADRGADPAGARTLLALVVDPQARSEVDVVDGTWPSSAPDRTGPVEVALSQESARRLGWSVGTVREGHLLTATWRARDAGADYWSLNPSMVRPYVFDDGNSPVAVTATAFASPARWSDSAAARSGDVQVWFPLALSGVRGGDLETLVAQLRRVTATGFSGSPDTTFALTAAGLPDLEGALGRARAAHSVLSLAAVGPVGAAAMVLLLAVRGLGRRRRPTLGLLAARGAPPLRLRALLALEGLLVAVPAGLLALAATWWVGGTPVRTGVVLAVVVVLAPAVVLAAVPVRASPRVERADVGVRREQPWRRVAEVAVLVLAAAATYLLLSAGLGATGGGVDALVVATPLLLSAAAGVVVLRAYPLPLRLVGRRLSRGRSTVGWLGALRALRDPALPVAPVLTVLLAVAVSVLAVVTSATLDRGTAQTALARTGAEVRLDGPVVDDATYARVLRLDGVAAAARVQDVGRTTVYVEGSAARTAELFRTDLDALVRVQRDVRGGVPASAARGDAVMARALGPAGRGVRHGSLEDLRRLDVAATAGGVAAVASGDTWLLADASTRGPATFAPRVLLVALEPGADPATVARDVRRLAGSRGTTTLAADATAALQRGPVTRGVRWFLLAAVAVVALAAVAAVLLSLLAGAAARARHLAVLRVLGVPAARRRWYAVWEQVPAVVVALVAGTLLGLGLAATVHATVDLRPFTGDAAQPPLLVPVVSLVLLLGAFVVLVALAVAVGTWWAQRRSSGEVLRDPTRMDEE